LADSSSPRRRPRKGRTPRWYWARPHE
jgi:hypothetical protein